VSLILFAVAAVSGVALCVTRRVVPNNGDEVPQHLELVAVFGALAAPYSLILMLMLAVGPRILYPGMPTVPLGAALGAAFGGIRGATAAAVHLLHWALGLESEFRVSRRHLLKGVVELCGSILGGVVMVTGIAAMAARIGPLSLFAVPILLAAHPLFDLVIMPRVTRLTRVSRSIGSEDRFGEALQAWSAEASDGAGLRPARLEVVETGMVNAWAIHMPLLRPTIMLSRPLLEEFSESAIRAIIAHEVAHVSSNHVPRMLLMSILGGTLFGLTIPVLFGLGLPGGMGTGAVLAGLTAIPLLGFGPGWFSKRFEFEADAKAASMVGARVMRNALKELAERTGGIDEESLTHPPISARVRRLGLADD
jgi:Zn-dependent protease with chaperone function